MFTIYESELAERKLKKSEISKELSSSMMSSNQLLEQMQNEQKVKSGCFNMCCLNSYKSIIK